MSIQDKVKVVQFLDVKGMDGYDSNYLNATGEIVKVSKPLHKREYSVMVKFENDLLNKLGYIFYNENELQLVN